MFFVSLFFFLFFFLFLFLGLSGSTSLRPPSATVTDPNQRTHSAPFVNPLSSHSNHGVRAAVVRRDSRASGLTERRSDATSRVAAAVHQRIHTVRRSRVPSIPSWSGIHAERACSSSVRDATGKGRRSGRICAFPLGRRSSAAAATCNAAMLGNACGQRCAAHDGGDSPDGVRRDQTEITAWIRCTPVRSLIRSSPLLPVICSSFFFFSTGTSL